MAKLKKPVRRHDVSFEILNVRIMDCGAHTNCLRREVVGRGRECLHLRQVQRQEAAATPADDKARKLHNREREKLPRNPDIEQQCLNWLRIRRVDAPLRFRRCAPTKIWVFFGDDSGLEDVRVFFLRDARLFAYLLGRCDFSIIAGRGGIERISVVSRLREHEDAHQNAQRDHGDVEPPEIAPADVCGHGARDDRTDLCAVSQGLILYRSVEQKGGIAYHERTHVAHPIQRIPLPTIMQEEDVGDHGGLQRLCWSGCEAVESVVCSVSVSPFLHFLLDNSFFSMEEMQTHTEAPIKLPYVFALLLQIALPRLTTWLAIMTGLFPNVVASGTQNYNSS